MASTAISVPEISQDDLASFYSRHFSTTSVDHFATNFLGPVDEEYTEVEEDDGLGYYEDGVKRTLTDAQIAIFRHSEIQALLRERRHAKEAAEAGEGKEKTLGSAADKEESEDGEVIAESTSNGSRTPSVSNGQPLSRKARKAEQARQKGYFKQKIKPDLRKRTWDKVDTGMGSLDYDDQSSGSHTANPISQRRKISYDD